MFALWLRMNDESRKRVWWLYGWFCGLMCFGSCVGAVTWISYMQYLVFVFTPFASNHQKLTLISQRWLWLGVYLVLYPLEFLCLTVSKLMVLHRMADFALLEASGMLQRVAIIRRILMTTVVAVNVACWFSNIAAAVHFMQAADAATTASVALAVNDTGTAINATKLAFEKVQLAANIGSVQQFGEMALLILIIAAFVVVGAACSHRLSDTPDRGGASGKKLHFQIIGTSAVVFVTFLLRAVVSIMYALADALQNESSSQECAERCDSACNNSFSLMRSWIIFTPAFVLIIILLSSPAALLVALWGMTSELTLQIIKSHRMEAMTPILDYTP